MKRSGISPETPLTTPLPAGDPAFRAAMLQALALSLGPAVALGLARFGYALLLPAMRADLGWTYAAAGGMNTANAIGYLLGALFAAPIAARWGTRRSFAGGMLVTALALLATGLATHYGVLLVWRFVSGVGGAIVFILGATLVTHLAAGLPARVGLVIGVYTGGVGIGILGSGLVLPGWLERSGPGVWPLAWIGMGIAAVAALVIARRVSRTLREPPARPAGQPRGFGARALGFALASYSLFGLGYIAYMTFIIAYLRTRGGGAGEVSLFWGTLGVATLLSAFVWGPVLDRLQRGRALAATTATVGIGAALPLLSTHPPVMLLSAALFGGSFLSVVAAITLLVRRSLPAHLWSGGIAVFTVAFALGQGIGPVLAGALADRAGGIAAGLGWSAAFLGLGAVAALLQGE